MGVSRNGGAKNGGNLYLYSRLLLKQARSFFSYLESMYIYLPNSHVKEGKKGKQKNRIA